MKVTKILVTLLLALSMNLIWAGEEPAANGEKLFMGASQSALIQAEVEAIDHETRMVTLRGPEGNSITFTASEEARNLGQVEVGNLVNVEYVQSVTVEVMDNPGVEAGAGEIVAAARSEKGAMPAGAIMDTKIITATVEDINIEANTFKLKWPEGNVEEFTARNPENLTKAQVGDLVVITKTEAMAISVEHVSGE